MTASSWLAAGLYLLPALVWAIMARQMWSYLPDHRPGSRLFHVAPVFMAVFAFDFLVHAAWSLVPLDLQQGRVGPALYLHALVEASALVTLGLALHCLRLMPVPEEPPSRWITPVYVWSAVAVVVIAGLRLLATASPGAQRLAEGLLASTCGLLAVLCTWRALRLARPGAWGPEGAGEVRRPDVVLIGAGLLLTAVAFLAVRGAGQARLANVVFEVGFGLAIAAPWALRMLGFVVPELLVSVALGAAIAAVGVGHARIAPQVDPRFRALFDFATLLALGLVAVQGQRWLRGAVDRLVFRRSQRQLAELQAFLHTLSPELGTLECCRRALAELVRVRKLRGAAIILRDGEPVVHGAFNLAPLLRVWPRGPAADALPARSFGTMELRELPLALREALVEANVGLGASPILSPRRRWGHLFMNTGLLGGTFREDDLQQFQAFVAQLGLLLDGADLLARAVAVERSLAHTEKLAAIGETAARIAHDIRNPVTAARSLAQQLARERRLSLAVAGANGSAAVQVTDTGPGVPPEALPRLFEPFFSLKPSGTGLGLAIARRTVEAHGGRIEATRAAGAGMRFRVELPLGGAS